MGLHVEYVFEFCQTVYPSIFALCLLMMTLCRCVEIMMVYNEAIIWPFLVYNVSKNSEFPINQPVLKSIGVGMHTYHIFFPITNFGVNQMSQQPINGLIIIEHLKE